MVYDVYELFFYSWFGDCRENCDPNFRERLGVTVSVYNAC